MNEKSKEVIRSILAICQKHNVSLEEVLRDALNESTTEQEQYGDIERRIANILKDLDFPIHYLAYRYIIYAVIFVMEHPDERIIFTSKLYPEIAKKYDTTPERVSKTICHALKVVWSREEKTSIEKVFGKTEKLTNTEFIYTLAELLKD